MAVTRRRRQQIEHPGVESPALVGDWRDFVPEHVDRDRLPGRLLSLGRFPFMANQHRGLDPAPTLSGITDVDVDAVDGWLAGMDVVMGSSSDRRGWAWSIVLRNSGR